jgi:hypothetical protein
MILSQKISKYSDDTYEDLFDEIFIVLVEWLEKQDNIYPITDFKTFRAMFFIFLIDNYSEGVNLIDDYPIYKYSEDIVETFLHMKDISHSYTSNILHEKFRTSDNLLHFIFDYCIYQVKVKENEFSNFHINELESEYENTI